MNRTIFFAVLLIVSGVSLYLTLTKEEDNVARSPQNPGSSEATDAPSPEESSLHDASDFSLVHGIGRSNFIPEEYVSAPPKPRKSRLLSPKIERILKASGPGTMLIGEDGKPVDLATLLEKR